MRPSKGIQIAAALQVLSAAAGLVSAVRILSAGSAGLPAPKGAEAMGGPPFWAGLMFFALAIASLFSAYGLVQGQRWGKVVAIITAAIGGVFMAGDVAGALALGAPLVALAFGLGTLGYLAILYLVLRREPMPRAA